MGFVPPIRIKYSPRVGMLTWHQGPLFGENHSTAGNWKGSRGYMIASTTNADASVLPGRNGWGILIPIGIGRHTLSSINRKLWQSMTALGVPARAGSTAPRLSEQNAKTSGVLAAHSSRCQSISIDRCWKDQRVYPLASISLRFRSMIWTGVSRPCGPNGCQNPISKLWYFTISSSSWNIFGFECAAANGTRVVLTNVDHERVPDAAKIPASILS